MTEMTKENQLRVLDYLNASVSLDFRRNKGIYIMIAKLYSAIKNQIGAYANALIAVEFSEISRDDEFFVEQCEKMRFPTPEDIIRSNDSHMIPVNYFLLIDVVLILEPGTYYAPFGRAAEEKNIVIIGIGEVTIKGSLWGGNCNFIMYNICVEYTISHSLMFYHQSKFL